jgi:DnaK suppressor protein
VLKKVGADVDLHLILWYNRPTFFQDGFSPQGSGIGGDTRMADRSEVVARERGKLLEERARVAGALERLREALKVEVDVDAEEGDPDLIEREKNVALLSQLEAKLEGIEAALRSIEKGKYGICERCGKEINPERLEVRPDATLCIHCQAEVEKLIRRGRLPREEEEQL